MTHEQSEQSEQSALHAKTVALALYQIRVLLSGYLGSQTEGDMSVRQAAHLAYALHNEALALVEGGNFDSAGVIRRLEAVDGMLGPDFHTALRAGFEPVRWLTLPCRGRFAWSGPGN